MKKIMSIVTVFAFAWHASAQLTSKAPGSGTSKIELENVMITSLKFNDGSNTVPVPNNRGTVKFTKRGNSIINVVYTDAAGKSVNLQPGNGAAGGTNPSCKCPLPDACFGTADKSIGLCMCKPCDLSKGGEPTYLIALLIPAIQKLRTPAERM